MVRCPSPPSLGIKGSRDNPNIRKNSEPLWYRRYVAEMHNSKETAEWHLQEQSQERLHKDDSQEQGAWWGTAAKAWRTYVQQVSSCHD